MLARTQYAAFGKILDADLADWKALALQEERERPLGRQELFMSMYYVGKHLNRAWNGRHASPEMIARHERQDLSRWERFPAHPVFNDLRPAPPPLRRTCRFPADTPVDAESAHACLQRAYRELEQLCELANEAFDASRNTVAASLDEKEFGHSLNQIYGQLALAWNNSFRANTNHSLKTKGRSPFLSTEHS